jgi:peptidyl-prolyl cis-trans isomerase C
MSTSTGCGGGACTCGGTAQPSLLACEASAQAPVATVNGIALHLPGERLAESELRERAWAELLRQEAVRQRLLAPPDGGSLEAPVLSANDRQAIEAMLENAVSVPHPTEDECHRYYDARQAHFVEGRMVHARHILFAVTSGVNVHALAIRAEKALLELSGKVGPGRFAELARELSNCPSSAQGGDLGWVGPRDCADEFANELFLQKNPLPDIGLRPRLVHTRYGFHIVEVLDRKQGRQLAFDEVRERIAVQLAQQSRAKALHQYIRLLAGQATVQGVSLESADSPLVQ